MIEQNIDHDHLLKLINGDIDGVLTSSQQAELEKLLVDSPRARELDGELREISGLLDQLPELEPPGHLRSIIVDRAKPVFERKEASRKRWVMHNLLPTQWLRTAMTVAAGVVLTVAIYETASKPVNSEEASSMIGTLIKRPDQAPGELLNRVDIETASVNGQIEFLQKDGMYILDVRLDAEASTQLSLDISGRALKLDSVHGGQSDFQSMSNDDGIITISGQGGQHVSLLLRSEPQQETQGDGSVFIKLFNNKTLVKKAEFKVSK